MSLTTTSSVSDECRQTDRHVEEYGLVKPMKRQAATPAHFMHNNEKATECVSLEVKLKQNELDRHFDQIVSFCCAAAATSVLYQ